MPFLYLRVENFSPHPPTPSSHSCYTSITRTSSCLHIFDMLFMFYERRNHLRFFRLGLTRVLLLFWYGGSFDFHTQLSVESIYTKVYHLIEDQNFRVVILEKTPVTVRRLQHLGRRPRAKNPTHILVREKKSAPPACL